MTSHSDQLDRIESKLDALIAALADEYEQGEPAESTLDGQPVPRDRNQNETL